MSVGFTLSELGQNLSVYTGTKMMTDMKGKVDGAEDTAVGAVNALNAQLNEEMQALIGGGIDKIYNSLGLTDSNIAFAKQLLNTVGGSITKVASILDMIPADVTCIPTVKDSLTPITTSFKEVAFGILYDLSYVYTDTVNSVITQLGQPLELLYASVYLVVTQVEQMVDEKCYEYTGYHILEVYNMCIKAFQLINQLKNIKKQNKNSGYDLDVNVGIDYDTRKQMIYKELYAYLDSISTPLYNAFLLLMMKDTVKDIQNTFERLINIDVDLMAVEIESLDDVVGILDYILGDNPTIVTLKDIEFLGLNNVIAAASQVAQAVDNAKNTSTLTGTMTTQNIIAGSTAMLDVNINAKKTYTIEYDADRSKSDNSGQQHYTLLVYKDPSQLHKQLTDNLRKIKNGQQQVIPNNEITSFISEVKNLWTNNQNGDIIVTGRVDGQKRIYAFHIQVFKTQEANKEPSIEPEQPNISDIWDKINDLEVDSPEIIQEENKGPIIFDIVTLVIKLIKPIQPVLKSLAHLVENYKINKRKVLDHARGNMNVSIDQMIQNVGMMKHNLKGNSGNNNSGNGNITETGNDANSNSGHVNFYTVRTYRLCNWLDETYGIRPGADGLYRLASAQTLKMVQDCSAFIDISPLTVTDETDLLFDNESINIEKDMLQSALHGIIKERDGIAYKDGSLNGLDTVERNLCTGEIYISKNGRSTEPSEILRAITRKYKP